VLRRPEAANLVAAASVAVYALFLRRVFDVPLRVSTVALMAIPLVHTHATSCYVDLPANVGAAVLLMSAWRIWCSPEEPSWQLVACALAGAAVAANTRFQLNPIVALVLAALAPRALSAVKSAPDRRALAKRAALVAALPIVFATPLKNLVRHGNPVYPVRLSFGGVTLPGFEDSYAFAPPHLASAPAPVRFAHSLLEIGIRPLADSSRWTIDQWMPSDSTGARLGGFFGAYVVLHVALLAWLGFKDAPGARRAALGFAGLTFVTAFMPQSHELRYYLYWMLVLVSVNLVLLGRARAPFAGVACAAALAVVVGVTRGGYLYPTGSSFPELLQKKVAVSVLAGIADGERICLNREPWTALYAAPFHGGGRRWVVHEVEEREECPPGARFIE